MKWNCNTCTTYRKDDRRIPCPNCTGYTTRVQATARLRENRARRTR